MVDSRSTPVGVPGIGDVPWGARLCHLYESDAELAELLVPYFAAGLARGEACVWVTPKRWPAPEARAALARAVPDLAERERAGQIEIVSESEWHARTAASNGHASAEGWREREREALARGHAGLRYAIDAPWNGRNGARALDGAFRGRRIVALHGCRLSACAPQDVLDAVRHHDLALARRDGGWEVLEAAERGSPRAIERSVATADAAVDLGAGATDALIDALPHLAWVADASGAWLRHNRRFADHTGLAPERARGAGWRDAVHPEDRAGLDAQWARATASGSTLETEARLRGTDGSYRWFLVRAEALRDARGAVTRWFGTCTDVEDQMRAARALRDADLRKDEFLALLGHELRNPLAPILTALQLLEIQGDFRREHEVIERQARHVARLVDDLLDVARVARGQLELRRRTVELHEIVGRGIEQAGPLIEKNRHRLVRDVPADGLEVHVDPARLAQVVGNLLTNAAKYTPAGGRISITGRRDRDGAVELTVADDGPGIAPEVIPTLFEPFTQLRQPLDRSHGGLGLGLALVRSLVKAHGGTVDVESPPGSGAVFTVRLPLAVDGESGPAHSDDLRLVLPPPSRRVLIVEDNPDAALMLSQALRLVGHRVEVAHDGPQALDTAAAFQPEVAVLDIGLPVMDGYELARRLRQRTGKADLRLIALTGYGQESDRRRSEEVGFERHLIKPVDLRLLRALIEEDLLPA